MEEEVIIPEEPIEIKMRYILNSNGYIANISFGAEISCDLGNCTEYNGDIPDGYSTLEEWHDEEIDRLNAWKIVDSNLVFDEAKCKELETRCAIEEEENAIATHKYVTDKLKVSNNVVTDELAVEKTGNSLITIIDTGNYNIPELKVTSNAINKFKVVSSNKNMLGVETITTTINGVEITNNGDGTITLNGTSTAAIEVNINGSETNTEMLYLIKENTSYGISGLTENVSLSLYSYDGTDRTFIVNSGNGNINLSTSYVITQTTLKIPSKATFKNVVISPQIELGNTTSFVKHEETSTIGILEKNECIIDSLNSYEEKTIIMIDKYVTTTVKYYKYQYLNEKLAEFEVTEEEVKSTLIEIDKTVEGQNQQISEISQRVGELNSKISETADVTTSRESLNGVVTLEEINESEPIYIKIYPTSENISYLYPRENLYPSNNLLVKARTLRFKNTVTNEIVDYELPNDLLYYDVDVYDEFILDYEMQRCSVNKRVGYNPDGTTYELDTPTIIEYEYPSIPLTDGNYEVSLVGYNAAYMFVRLMATNIYTTQFATKAELKSEITQLSNEVKIEVEQKVNEDEIIASLNVAVKEGQGVINLTGNQVTIDSDNFELNADGTITAKAGNIAGWNILEERLYKTLKDSNGNLLQSGLYVMKNNTSTGTPFIFAGFDGDETEYPTTSRCNLMINHLGYVAAKYFSINGESGLFYITFDSGKQAFAFDEKGIIWKLDDANNNKWFEIERGDATQWFSLYDAPQVAFYDGVHGKHLMRIRRTDGYSDANTYFETNIYVSGNRQSNGINNTIYIQGYEVATNASDERLKKNILDSEIKALELINKIHHKSFDWDKEKANKEGHIDIGYIAQELIQIDPNFVIYNEEFDTYQINLLYVLATSTKAIQELDKKIEKRDKIIEFLAEKLNCKDEVLEMLKEGE